MSKIVKVSIVLLTSLLFSQLNFAQDNSKPEFIEKSKILDSLIFNSFMPASNSNDYLIIRKESHAYLKDLIVSLEGSLKKPISEDSTKRVNLSEIIDSLNNQIMILKQQSSSFPEPIVESGSLNFYQFFSILTSVIIVLIFIKLISQTRYIMGVQEAFIEVENTFQAHKRKSIEKERKVKRELIDANSRLEALKNQLKLLNHSD